MRRLTAVPAPDVRLLQKARPSVTTLFQHDLHLLALRREPVCIVGMIRAQSALLPDPVFRVRQVVSNCTRLREAATGAASTMATAALISHEARIVIALLGVLMLLREVVVAATVRAPSVEVAAVREVVAAEAAGVDKDRNVWRSKK